MDSTNEAPAPKSSGGILVWISNHPAWMLITLLATIATLVSCIMGFFPWWTSPAPNLSYCVYPLRFPIVQTSKPSDVTVSYKLHPVGGNVTAAHIAIWNAGRAAIRPSDILSAIVLYTPSNAPILEMTALKTSRREAGITLTSTNLPGGLDAIDLNWTILEHNDGVMIQIVYAGAPETPIYLEGSVVGQKSIHHRSISAREPLPKVIATSVAMIMTSFAAFHFVRDNYRGCRRVNDKRKVWLLVTTIIVFGTVGLAAALFGFAGIFSLFNATPFGF